MSKILVIIATISGCFGIRKAINIWSNLDDYKRQKLFWYPQLAAGICGFALGVGLCIQLNHPQEPVPENIQYVTMLMGQPLIIAPLMICSALTTVNALVRLLYSSASENPDPLGSWDE